MLKSVGSITVFALLAGAWVLMSNAQHGAEDTGPTRIDAAAELMTVRVEGFDDLIRVDAEAFEGFRAGQLRSLEAERARFIAQMQDDIAAVVAASFEDARQRVSEFADDHFSIATSLSSAMTTAFSGMGAAGAYVFGSGDGDISGAIYEALADQYRTDFTVTVLRPEERTAFIAAGVSDVMLAYEQRFVRLLEIAGAETIEFLRANGEPVDAVERARLLRDAVQVDLQQAAGMARAEEAALAVMNNAGLIAGAAMLGGLLGPTIALAIETLIAEIIGETAVLSALEAGLASTGVGAVVAGGVAWAWVEISETWERPDFESRHMDAVTEIVSAWAQALSQEAGLMAGAWFDQAHAAVLSSI